MMNQKLALQAQKARTAVFRFAFAPAVALLAGCASEGDALDATGGASTPTQQQDLIGGRTATADQYRSTVGIGDACTAAKVGPRLFLTAAHCVAVPRPSRFEPVPDDFPPNDGIREDYLPGKQVLIHWGLHAEDQAQAEFTIVRTSIHPSWWACPLCQTPILSQGGAADIAVVEIAQDTPLIPMARVELDAIQPGAQVVKVGWGCEERTNIDPSTLELGRYKVENGQVIPATEAQHERAGEPTLTDSQVAMVAASYLVTAGRAQGQSYASLCLGDSGGPLYLADPADPRIVGVNADYTFKPPQDPDDLGGVSWTDWHTKTALDSLHGVGQWLIDLGVKTVGGDASHSGCTCPKGCEAVQRASVPFSHSGPTGSCYFFESLGYSVNSHSMARVDLNGTNITNRWVGHWSYPARRDGGYYLYLSGNRPWSWAQAIQ